MRELSTAQQDRFVIAIELGATRELAAKYVDVSRSTLQRWLVKARKGEAGAFGERILLAEGVAVVRWLGQINAAAERGKWKAAQWLLERCHPHAYGRTEARHLSTPDRHGEYASPVVFVGLTTAEQDASMNAVMGW